MKSGERSKGDRREDRKGTGKEECKNERGKNQGTEEGDSKRTNPYLGWREDKKERMEGGRSEEEKREDRKKLNRRV